MDSMINKRAIGGDFLRRLMIGMLLLLILFNINRGSAIGKDSVRYIGELKGVSIGQETYNKLSTINNGTFTKEGLRYVSEIKALNAIVKYDNEKDKSYITINWNKHSKTIIEQGLVSGINWRPRETGFIYIKDYEVEGDEGDYGMCTLNYVKLNLKRGGIIIERVTKYPPQVYTTISWSQNGKYYAYSEYASLRIKNVETGQVWATKSINLDKGKIKIKAGSFYNISDFSWIENDKRIAFFWKEHPEYEEPSGYGVISIQQFKLR